MSCSQAMASQAQLLQGREMGCSLRAIQSQFAGIPPSPRQVLSPGFLDIVLLSMSIQGSSEDLQGKGGCSELSVRRVVSTEGAASETQS